MSFDFVFDMDGALRRLTTLLIRKAVLCASP